jgi:peptidoglycan/xylan/chitin deacetylase (PgdA/CDA1 family)
MLSIVVCALIVLTILFSMGTISLAKDVDEPFDAADTLPDMTAPSTSYAADADAAADHLRASMLALASEQKKTAQKAKEKKNAQEKEDEEESDGFEIDPDAPMVALTFDDGPAPYTDRILEILEENNSHATFCVLGNRVASYAKTIKKTQKQGSQIIGHSWDHKLLTKLSATNITLELTKTNTAIKKVTGKAPAFYRPPYGGISDSVEKISKDQGLSMILWSVDTLDWKYRSVYSIYNRTMSRVQDGSIILCHDIHPTTAQAMEKVIPALIKQGYQLVTVEELLKAKGIKIKPGKRYSKGIK